MNDIRKIVVETPREFATDTAQLFARAWLKDGHTIVTENLHEEFRESGRVVCFHLASNNFQPGFCYIAEVRRLERISGPCHWQVVTNTGAASLVVKVPNARTIWDVYSICSKGLVNGQATQLAAPCETILIQTAAGDVFGPFIPSNDRGKLTAPSGEFKRWDPTNVVQIEANHRAFGVPKAVPAETFLSDPALAFKKLLRHIKEQQKWEWLTRSHISQLEQAFLDFREVVESKWILSDAAALAAYLRTNVELANNLISEFRELSPIKTALAEMKAELETDVTSRIEREYAARLAAVESRESAVNTLETENAQLNETNKSLRSESAELAREVETQKERAARAFNEELQSIASNPASVAVLSALFSRTTSEAASSQTRPTDTPPQSAAVRRPLADALEQNLAATGLGKRCSSAVASAVSAALISGQPVTFTGCARRELALAALVSLDVESVITLDTPIGQLDPIRWERGNSPAGVFVSDITRSSVDVVLGNWSFEVTRQALSGTCDFSDFIFTAASNESLQPIQEICFGPIIDTDSLSFREPRLDGEPAREADRATRDRGKYDKFDLDGECDGFTDRSLPGPFRHSLGYVYGAFGSLFAGKTDQIWPIIAAWWLYPRATDTIPSSRLVAKIEELGIRMPTQ